MKGSQRINTYKLFAGVFIPEAICKLEDLSLGAKVVYGRLCRYAGENAKCWPAVESLMMELSISESACRRHIRELEEYGLIETEGRPGQSNLYYFLDDPCFHTAPDEQLVPLKVEAQVEPKGGQNDTPVKMTPLSKRPPRGVKMTGEGGQNDPQRESEESQRRESFPIDPETSEETPPKRSSSRFRKKEKPPPDPNSQSQRLRRMRENGAAEPVAGFEIKNSHSFPKTVVADPTTGLKTRNYATEWNEHNPKNKCDPKLRQDTHGFKEQTFRERWPEILDRATVMIKKGADLKLGWLVRKDTESGLYNWERMMDDEFNWMLKKTNEVGYRKFEELDERTTE